MKKAILMHGLPADSFYEDLDKKDCFFVTESRPDLSGTKIVARKLMQRRLDTTLICDNMAAFCMAQNKISRVYLFYCARKGIQLMCKVGSLGLAILAKRHGIPVYAFPGKPLKKLATKNEIIHFEGRLIAPRDVLVHRALIDEVPARLIKKVA